MVNKEYQKVRRNCNGHARVRGLNPKTTEEFAGWKDFWNLSGSSSYVKVICKTSRSEDENVYFLCILGSKP